MSSRWRPFHRAHPGEPAAQAVSSRDQVDPRLLPEDATRFDLPGWNPPVKVILPPGLSAESLLKFKAFDEWQKCLKKSLGEQKRADHPFNRAKSKAQGGNIGQPDHRKQFRLQEITVQSFDTANAYGQPSTGRLLFVKIFAHIVNELGEALPGVVFLRGGSVTVLMILTPYDDPSERYVIMTEQPRIAAGSLRFQELPAGMLDDENNFTGAAAREVEEEVNIKIEPGDLIDMTELALRAQHRSNEPLQDAMYPSPGACDEFISIFLWEQQMDRADIDGHRNRLTGKRAEQEHIRVRLEEYENLLQIGARDAKTLAAWSLYEFLQRTRLLDEARRHPH